MATVRIVPSTLVSSTGWDAEGPVTAAKLQSDDGNTSALYSPTSGNEFLFTMSSSGLGSVTINSITFGAKVSKLDPIDALTRIIIKIGSTTYESGDFSPTATNTYETQSWTLTQKLGTSSPWTVSDLSTMQVGLRKANSAGQRVTYMYADVDYTPAATPNYTKVHNTDTFLRSSLAPATVAQNIGATSGTNYVQGVTATLPGDVLAGNTLIVSIASSAGEADTITSVADTKGNTWVKATSYGINSRSVDIWYATNAIGGPTSVTVNSTQYTQKVITLLEVNGLASPAVLGTVAKQGDTAYVNTRTIAVAGGGKFVIAAFAGTDGGAVYTSPAGTTSYSNSGDTTNLGVVVDLDGANSMQLDSTAYEQGAFVAIPFNLGSDTPAPITPPPAANNTPNWYPYGVLPTGKIVEQLRTITKNWWTNHVKPYIISTGMPSGLTGAYRVVRPENSNDTVSEGIGYVMIGAVLMADYDPQGQEIFDKLYKYAKFFFDANGLMKWHIDSTGTPLDQYSATDADYDIAWALHLAVKKWGTSGNYNYTTERDAMLAAMLAYDHYPANHSNVSLRNVMINGDGWDTAQDGGANFFDPDYIAPMYYEAWSALNPRWSAIKARNWEIIQGIPNKTTGLFPDRMTREGGPASGQNYVSGYNTIRRFRQVADYLNYGSTVSPYTPYYVEKNLADFMATKAASTPANLRAEWTIDGATSATYINSAFASAYMTGMLVNGDHAQFASDIIDWIVAHPDGSYFGDTVAFMNLATAAGYMGPELVNESGTLSTDYVNFTFQPVVAQGTKLHTTDAVKRNQFTKVHTTSVNKVVRANKAHSTDTLKRLQAVKTHSTDTQMLFARRFNLVNNPSVEADLTGIAKGGTNLVMTQDGTRSLSGTKSLKLVQTQSLDEYAAITSYSALKPNTNYTFSAWFYLETYTSEATNFRGLLLTNSAVNPVGETIINAATPRGQWIRQQLTVNTGSGTTLQMRMYSPVGTIYWDAFQLEEGTNATPYFDGSSVNGYWRGTPNQSASYSLANVYNLAHTTSTVIKRRVQLTQSTDVVRRKAYTSSQTTDTLKRRSYTISHNTDTSARSGKRSISHTTDLYKRYRFFLAHSTDAVLRRRYATSHSTNVNKTKRSLLTQSTDVSKKARLLRAHSTDVVRRAQLIKSQVTDIYKRVRVVKVHNTDLVKRGSYKRTHLTDVYTRLPGGKFHATDTVKRKMLVRTHTTDIQKRKTFPLAHATSTNKRKLTQILHTTNTLKRQVNVRTHATDVAMLFARRRNYVLNPSVENDIVGYNTYASSTLAQVTGGLFGDYALQVTNAGVVGGGGSAGGTQYTIADLQPSTVYTISFYAKVISGNVQPAVYSELGTNTQNTNGYMTPSDGWRRITSTITTGSGRSGGFIYLRTVGSNQPNAVWLIDGFMVENGSVATPYFDGDSINAGWRGTPGQSVSYSISNVYTSIHSTDTLIRKRLSTTHTTDGLLKARINKSFTTNTLKRKATNRTQTADVLKRQKALRVHTTNVLKRAVFKYTHSTDVLLEARVALSHGTNTVLRASTATSHSTDALLRMRQPFNYAYNGDFEIGSGPLEVQGTPSSVTGWVKTTSNTGGSAVIDPTGGINGSQAVRMTADASGGNIGIASANDAYGRTVPIPGMAYTLSFYARSTTNGGTVDYGIFARVGSTTWYLRNNDTWQPAYVTINAPLTTSYSLISKTFTPPAGTTQLWLGDLKRGAVGNNSNRVFYFDNISLVPVTWHTTDVNKRSADNPRLHTTDAIKRSRNIVAQKTDVQKRLSGLYKIHTTNTNLRKVTDRVHATDVLKRNIVLTVHSTDSLKRKLNLLSSQTDVNKRKVFKRIHSTNVNISAAKVTRHATDVHRADFYSGRKRVKANGTFVRTPVSYLKDGVWTPAYVMILVDGVWVRTQP